MRSNSPARSQIVTSILPPPPAQKFVKNPLLKTMPPRNPPAVPAPTRSLVACDVVGRWHQVEQSKLSAWCQNGPCCPPPKTPKIHRFPPSKSEAATPSPGRFSPRQRGRQLIVMSLRGGIKRNSQNCPHGAKMAPVAQPPERLKYIDSPLLKAKPPRHPPDWFSS